jgi:hypothetical protein
MRPLVVGSAGVALVALDFRTESLDLLADPVGWGLVGVAAGWLALPLAARLAWATALLSLADAALPYHYVRVDPFTGEAVVGPAPGRPVSIRLDFFLISGWRLAALAASVVTGGATLWVLLGRLARRAAYEEDDRGARRLRLARWAVIACWIVPYLVTVAIAVLRDDGRYDPVWNHGLEYLGLAGLAAAIYVAVVLAGSAGASWAQREGFWVPSPWDQLRLNRVARRPPN